MLHQERPEIPLRKRHYSGIPLRGRGVTSLEKSGTKYIRNGHILIGVFYVSDVYNKTCYLRPRQISGKIGR